MGLTFQMVGVYAAPAPASDFTYLFAAEQQPAGGPWIGAFGYAKQDQGSLGPNLPLTGWLFAEIASGAAFAHMGVLILPSAPTTAGLPAFRTALLQAQPAPRGGLVLWLQQLGAFAATDPQLAFASVQAAPGPFGYALANHAQAILQAGGAGRTLFVDPTAAGQVMLAPNPGDDGLVLSLGAGKTLAISLGDKASPSPAIQATQAGVPLVGAQAGCLCAAGTSVAGAPPAKGATSATGFPMFELGFQYAVTPARALSSQPGRLSFPLPDLTETLGGAQVSAAFDPVGLAPARNQLQVAPAGGSFVSAYRTAWNEPVLLAPLAGASFVGATSLDGRLYFTPSGGFALAVGAGDTGVHELVCGLSAVETLSFTGGDQLVFQPTLSGGVIATVGSGLGFTFSPITPDTYGAGVATLVAGPNSQSANLYCAEAPRSPFFTSHSGDPVNLLRHDPLIQGALPAAQDPGFPLLPMAAVQPILPGFGAMPGAVTAFEMGYLMPMRSSTILGWAVEPPAGQAAWGVTPQGYLAQFDAEGGILSLSLGNGGGCSLVFEAPAPAGGGARPPLPAPLRDALLAPQSFVVASCAVEPYWSNCAITLSMTGWAFTFQPPTQADIAPGDYQSVLIVKSAPGTVVDLAAQPSVWTGYGLFNDKNTDPDGTILSSWLSTYIAQALAQYAGGQGPEGLQTFADLVQDPDWVGFLCLRVPVAVSQLPSALDFLLAGVDTSQLIAHHIGCASNQVEPDAGTPGTYDQESAFFGFVHYVRPGAPPSGAVQAPFLPSGAPFDFELMRLEAVFENSRLTSFSSSALVMLNSLFGDLVLVSQSGPGPAATNTILINGVLQNHGTTPNYVFSTPVGMSSTFYLSSAAFDRIEIDRANVTMNGFTTVKRMVNGQEIEVVVGSETFRMAGWLGLLPAGVDLLSYAAIPFSNLALTMTYDKDTGANKSFVLDPSSLALTPLIDASVPLGTVVTAGLAAANVLYREASLAAAFPLQISQLIIGGGQTPTDMGFQSLVTVPATGGGGAISGPSWYGLEVDLPLGGSGALDSSGLIDVKLLFAWMPGGSGTPGFSAFLKLTGPGGVNLSFSLEGILKFGAKGIVLRQVVQQTQTIFVLEFASIAVTLFTKSFPPAGSTNLLVAGIGRTIGWFGAYVDPSAPPMSPPDTAQLSLGAN